MEIRAFGCASPGWCLLKESFARAAFPAGDAFALRAAFVHGAVLLRRLQLRWRLRRRRDRRRGARRARSVDWTRGGDRPPRPTSPRPTSSRSMSRPMSPRPMSPRSARAATAGGGTTGAESTSRKTTATTDSTTDVAPPDVAPPDVARARCRPARCSRWMSLAIGRGERRTGGQRPRMPPATPRDRREDPASGDGPGVDVPLDTPADTALDRPDVALDVPADVPPDRPDVALDVAPDVPRCPMGMSRCGEPRCVESREHGEPSDPDGGSCSSPRSASSQTSASAFFTALRSARARRVRPLQRRTRTTVAPPRIRRTPPSPRPTPAAPAPSSSAASSAPLDLSPRVASRGRATAGPAAPPSRRGAPRPLGASRRAQILEARLREGDSLRLLDRSCDRSEPRRVLHPVALGRRREVTQHRSSFSTPWLSGGGGDHPGCPREPKGGGAGTSWRSPRRCRDRVPRRA